MDALTSMRGTSSRGAASLPTLYKMILNSLIIFLCLQCVWSLEVGDACVTENRDSGSCKLLEDCGYAVKLIESGKKPGEVCRWDYTRNMKVVCCPIENRDHTIGAFRSYFRSSQDGTLCNDDVTCLYDGTLPIVCCENVPEAPPPSEPKDCPALKLPQGDSTDIAFQKCLEYQRYVSPCVSSDAVPGTYERDDACGVNSFGDRISGGSPAATSEFPHMALLGCRNKVDTRGQVAWVAGGSLISDRYVLTAGHVLAHRDYGQLEYVLLGATNKSEARDGLLFNIKNIIPHKRWVKTEKKHDIALLLLDRRVEFSEFVRPACLPSPRFHLGKERIVAGWGNTGESAQESQVLLKAYINELDYETECKPVLGTEAFDPETMTCAGGGKNDTRDTCQGDSGGPFMAISTNVECSYIVRGVVSHGPRCGVGVPGLYTRVEAYVDWITDIVWKREIPPCRS